MLILTCKLGNEIINCYDGTHTKEQLKKWASKKVLLCPVCGKPYEYCHGDVKTPYFRHKDKTKCEYLYSEPETEEHIKGKRDLYEWIKKQPGVTNAVLEAWLPNTKQRPDIMFDYYGKRTVIEYQCSPISTEYNERHDLYKAAKIKDIWILGTEKYLQPNMREKYIEKESVGFYDSKNKIFVFDSYRSSILDVLKVKNIYKYSYSNIWNQEYYGFPLSYFFFYDDNLFHRNFTNLEKSLKIHERRSLTKHDEEEINYKNSKIYFKKIEYKTKLNLSRFYGVKPYSKRTRGIYSYLQIMLTEKKINELLKDFSNFGYDFRISFSGGNYMDLSVYYWGKIKNKRKLSVQICKKIAKNQELLKKELATSTKYINDDSKDNIISYIMEVENG